MENIELNNDAPKATDVLFKVTTLSKILAGIVFITLPFLGFLLGTQFAVPEQLSVIAPDPLLDVAGEKQKVIDVPASVMSEGRATTTVTSYIVSVNTKEIVLDYVDVFSTDEAFQKQIEDGLCTAEKKDDCSFFYDRNKSSELRTFTIASNVVITNYMQKPISIGELSPYLASGVQGSQVRTGALFEIMLNSKNEVVQMKEIFRP